MTRLELPLHTPAYTPTGSEHARIRTSRGLVIVELFGQEAPVTVGNFVELATRGFYDGLKFHAKKADSVVVGGCPVTRGLGPAQVHAAVRGVLHGIHPGTGTARHRIIDEWENNPRNQHLDGSLVMAHGSEPDSGSSQFYFSLAVQPQFDSQYTVFGRVIEGLEVVHALNIGDVIEAVTIEGLAEEAAAPGESQRSAPPQ
ncbi:MAG: peptidylprolyl isomerase [Bifidobacteriaceae bacterium]|jgi:peptidyl-prolyl cis-trans isomerase B (cyclophilin B)|nr:peptidylprolyl isomerase [Bifidobacteriaceae bacterium]